MLLSKLLRVTSLVLLCAPLTFSAADAFAKGKEKKPKKGKVEKAAKGGGGGNYAYGMAGCGLGSVVIKSDTMMPQVTAGTLNGTGFQTSAISCTGSSNCGKEKAEAHRMEQEVFVAANLRNLEVDVSSGGGSYVHAFAETLGCTADEHYGDFLEVSRANYQDIFGASDPQVVYVRYMQAIRANAKLANGCLRMVYKS